MPAFKAGTIMGEGHPAMTAVSLQYKDWCEVQYYDIIALGADEQFSYPVMGTKEKVVVADGAADVSKNGDTSTVTAGNIESRGGDDAPFEVRAGEEGAKVVRLAGDWGDDYGGEGMFRMGRGDPPDMETPREYPKETPLDNHYHDGDEYWIITEGSGVAVSEGRFYQVGPGDCIATGMGHHHDFPLLHEAPLRGVFFETTLEGEQRRGHLWEPEHGPADPQPERI